MRLAEGEGTLSVPSHPTPVQQRSFASTNPRQRAGVLGGQAQQAALQMHDLIVQRDRVDGRELFPQPLFDRLGYLLAGQHPLTGSVRTHSAAVPVRRRGSSRSAWRTVARN